MAKARKPVQRCAIDGCEGRAQTTCSHCQRRVCQRHAGAARRGIASGPSGRCALCRLQGQKRAAMLTRRLWYGAAIVGFLALDGFAFYNNGAQGLALLLLVPLVALLAILYDRSLRRGVPLWSLPRRRTQAPSRRAGDSE